MQTEYTEDELASLSEAERAIVESGLPDAGEDQEVPATPDDEPAATKAPEVITPEVVDNVAATPIADDPDNAELVFDRQTPADAAATREALTTRKNEAFTKLMDGEIDAAEYQKIDTEVSTDLEKLQQAVITDNVTAAITQAQIQKSWKSEYAGLIKSAAQEGIDYTNPEINKELDVLLKTFSHEAGLRGMTDENLKGSKWALQQAHATMKLRHPEMFKASALQAAKAVTPAAPARKQADLSTLPPNLRGAPVAAAPDVSGEFTHMENLSGLNWEKAYASLSKEAQERYLS